MSDLIRAACCCPADWADAFCGRHHRLWLIVSPVTAADGIKEAAIKFIDAQKKILVHIDPLSLKLILVIIVPKV